VCLLRVRHPFLLPSNGSLYFPSFPLPHHLHVAIRSAPPPFFFIPLSRCSFSFFTVGPSPHDANSLFSRFHERSFCPFPHSAVSSHSPGSPNRYVPFVPQLPNVIPHSYPFDVEWQTTIPTSGPLLICNDFCNRTLWPLHPSIFPSFS